MAPPNNESKPKAAVPKLAKPSQAPAPTPGLFALQNGTLTVGVGGGKATLLADVPGNVTLTPFAAAFDPDASDTPRDMVRRAVASAHRGAFLGLTAPAATDHAPCRVGRLPGPRRTGFVWMAYEQMMGPLWVTSLS